MKTRLALVPIALSLLLAPAAFAGTTFIGNAAPSAPVNFAAETAFVAPNNVYVLPQDGVFPPGNWSRVNRVTTIIPNNSIPGISDTVFVEINLLDTATFGNVATVTNTALLITGFPNCTNTVTTPLVSATQIRFRVVFGNFPACTGPGTFVFTPKSGGANLTVTDTSGNLVTAGGTIRVQMRTLDGADVPTDAGGVDTVTFLRSVTATAAAVFPTTATIDVTLPSAKKNFVPGGYDTTTQDGGGAVGFTIQNDIIQRLYSAGGLFPNVFDRLGPDDGTYCGVSTIDGALPYFCGAGGSRGFYTINLSGDFTGVSSIVYNPYRFGGFLPRSATINGSTATIALGPRDSFYFSYPPNFAAPFTGPVINVDGTTVLTPRTINVSSVTFTDIATSTIKNTPVAASTPFTTWTYNGSVLFAPFANGNTNQFKSRFYVCIPQSSGTTGATIKILKQPVTGSSGTALATVTTTEPLASQGCLNFRLEDILTSGGISQPYTADGGNLALEFTLLAAKAMGTVNVINFQPSTGPESIATYDMFVEK